MTIRALTFDTGGTILDWHSGVRTSQDSAEEIRVSEIGGHKRSDDGPSEAKKDVRAASPL